MKKWYLIQTKPQQEAIATQNLSNQGFNVFYPKAIINNKTVSLFPRYLFIELDDKKSKLDTNSLYQRYFKLCKIWPKFCHCA